ncbi:DsbE family thiol:disulfide interchange protein [Woodsholea maritima]|uniref:DsbE family thiol:disulfide interchange protein n=1 Tax=Woodsholea maritima TaxID=240237 RepID=UPI000371AD6C|nr:DsbE family thiol:disulfide interchange protein [Woodsholea maritima]
MSRVLLWAPIASVLILIVVFALALNNPREDVGQDPLIGHPLPSLPLEALPGGQIFDPATIEGPYLLNIWASWCAPCRIEHPMLSELNDAGIPIYGIIYKDKPETAGAFLTELGNPFTALAADPEGRAALELGVTGAPETWVIDQNGIVRARWRGAITRNVWNDFLAPPYRAAERGE